MKNTRTALLWALLILAAAYLAVALDLPATSQAILITTLTAGAAASITGKRTARCRKG